MRNLRSNIEVPLVIIARSGPNLAQLVCTLHDVQGVQLQKKTSNGSRVTAEKVKTLRE